MLKQLAQLCYRRRRVVLLAWIVVLVGMNFASSAIGGAFRTDFDLPNSESVEAQRILERGGFADRAGFQTEIVFRSDQGIDDPEVESAMEAFFTRITDRVRGTTIGSPYAEGAGHQVAESGDVAYARLDFADRTNEAYKDAADAIKTLREQVRVPGLEIELGGEIFAEEPSTGSESFGILAAIVILLLAFGSVLAMGLPLLTALFGIGSGVAIVLMLRSVVDMPEFTTQAVMMIGIGVGIDYALFIVTRYREALHAGSDPQASVARAIDTAGRAVLFAGTTVIISLMGMFLMNLPMMRGVAIGTSIGVLMTMLAAVTLLPAVLGFVGRNIDKWGLPHRRSAEHLSRQSWSFRWSRVLQRHPVMAFTIGLGLLLAMSIPLLSLRLGFADAGNRSDTDTTRRAYDLISEGFGPGFNGPFLVVASSSDGVEGNPTLEELQDRLAETRGVAAVTAPVTNDADDVGVFQVFPTTAPQDQETMELVQRLRNDVVPSVTRGSDVEVKVGGVTAAVEDFSDYTLQRLPIFIGAVLLLSFLLLMTVFRSLLVALKAVVMNLLSIGAAYGVVVAVFQWGWAGDLIGIGREGPVEAWAPMFLFAIVFGLSMDYEVFLLSRIKEEYDRTGDNALAVADGVAATARVITAAAAIMIFVFGGFILGDERAIKLFGMGMSVAVLLDATLVRMVLVPATMELLGDRNWWLPRWLDRILPHVHVDAIDDVDAELAELEESERTTIA